MVVSGVRRCGVRLVGTRMRVGLLMGAVALGCGAGVAGAQSGSSGAAAPRVYWVNEGGSGGTFGGDNGTVVEAQLNGTHARTVARGLNYAGAVAVGDDHLYWVTTNGGGGMGTIVEASLNGTHPKTIGTFHFNFNATGPLVAVGGGHLYWAEGHSGATNGTIVEADLNGTRPETIAKRQKNLAGLAVGGGHLYWIVDGSEPAPSYPGGFLHGKVIEADLGGTHAKTIAKHQSNLGEVAVGDGHLYWWRNGRIVEAQLDGSHATAVAHPSVLSSGLAVGGGHVYWANGLSYPRGKVIEADLNGTHAKMIAKHQNTPGAVAVGP